MTSSHEHVSDRRLQLYVEGELSAAEAEEARRHIEICATCRATADEIRGVLDALKSDTSEDPIRPVWPQVETGLRRQESRRLVIVSGVAAAAGLLIAFLIGWRTEPIEQSKWYDLVAAVVRGQTVHCARGGKEVHAADVARAIGILLTAEGICGQAYNCYDRYVSEWEVAQLAQELSGSRAAIEGEPKQPRHQIVTEKLRALGMTFGGTQRLRQTVAEMVAATDGGLR